MNKFVIICGGECRTEGLAPDIFDGAYIIAADSGYDTAMKLNVTPDLLVGDMDSIKNVPVGVEVYKVKAEKDDTDTMLAISIAEERGADEIVIVGGGGGRADHFLSNIFMLEYMCDKGICAELNDGVNVIRVLKDSYCDILADGGYFGLIALEDSTVSAEGCKYPLKDAPLKRTLPYAVSNEVTSNAARITVKGKVIVIRSRK